MNSIDGFKVKIIVEEAKKQLQFLELIKAQDDISSELAGYEISKLLKTQEQHQETYAKYVKKRAQLTDISQKKQLAEIESKIAHTSAILKESTKKLCKLFKENPDLQRDSLKVARERRQVIHKLQDLVMFVEASQVSKYQQYISDELGNQDQLRQFIQKEKKLTQAIKQLQILKIQQTKEYQKETREAENKIQDLKETLMYKSNRAQLQISYNQKEKDAELSNLERINDYKKKTLNSEIHSLDESIKVCTRVHSELKEYLVRTEQEIKEQSDMWNDKAERQREKLQQDIKDLQTEMAQQKEQLEEYQQLAESQQQRKYEREREQKNKELAQAKAEYDRKRTQNAIKMIQLRYQFWKQNKKKKKRR